MSGSSLAAYLAKNYLTADAPAKKTTKKRKRKEGAANVEAGITINDDDATTWNDNANKSEDEDSPVILGGIQKTFKKKTTSGWKTIAEAEETAAADKILAANMGDRVQDEEPAVEDTEGVLKMESGVHAGLQTGAQVAAQLAAAKEAERKRFMEADPMESGRGQETIYRDASGRIINIAMQRAEARKKIAEEEEKALKEKELQKGDVQKLQAEERRKKLEDAKFMTLARYADDKEMNDEMKDQDRWNDPAAAFLTKKKGGGKSKTGRPVYMGPAAPNRFGIRPGHKWDGVDRGNGFEAKWFMAQNKKKETVQRRYESMMDID
ncbi:Pre-mRNA-splicing factor of RES complex-domain-containing protein [Pyronema omphalodes]|nr:Pre-mRNA-splicing factor of RES complex-domain-containing protein [Pyronema omphalodes]